MGFETDLKNCELLTNVLEPNKLLVLNRNLIRVCRMQAPTSQVQRLSPKASFPKKYDCVLPMLTALLTTVPSLIMTTDVLDA